LLRRRRGSKRAPNEIVPLRAFPLTNFENFTLTNAMYLVYHHIAWPPTSRLRDMHALTKAGDPIRRSPLELLPSPTLRIFTPISPCTTRRIALRGLQRGVFSGRAGRQSNEEASSHPSTPLMQILGSRRFPRAEKKGDPMRDSHLHRLPSTKVSISHLQLRMGSVSIGNVLASKCFAFIVYPGCGKA